MVETGKLAGEIGPGFDTAADGLDGARHRDQRVLERADGGAGAEFAKSRLDAVDPPGQLDAVFPQRAGDLLAPGARTQQRGARTVQFDRLNSGTGGTSATLVVTPKRAAVFADSRYWTQAEAELAGTTVELVKIPTGAATHHLDWIAQTLAQGEVLAVGSFGRVAVAGPRLAPDGAAAVGALAGRRRRGRRPADRSAPRSQTSC